MSERWEVFAWLLSPEDDRPLLKLQGRVRPALYLVPDPEPVPVDDVLDGAA
jgi:hypothetical protein